MNVCIWSKRAEIVEINIQKSRINDCIKIAESFVDFVAFKHHQQQATSGGASSSGVQGGAAGFSPSTSYSTALAGANSSNNNNNCSGLVTTSGAVVAGSNVKSAHNRAKKTPGILTISKKMNSNANNNNNSNSSAKKHIYTSLNKQSSYNNVSRNVSRLFFFYSSQNSYILTIDSWIILGQS